MVDILIQNGFVVTVDKGRRVLKDGAVAITGDSIVDVGSTDELKKKHRANRIIDATKKAVLPGLIDTHSHAGTLIRGVGHVPAYGHRHSPPLKSNERYLMDHIEFRSSTKELWYVESLLTALERCKSGTTCAMVMLGGAPRGDDPIYAEMNAKGVEEVGIRTIIGVGPGRPPWPKEFCDWENGKRIDKLVTRQQSLKATEEAIRKLNNTANGRIRVFGSLARFGAPSPGDPMYALESQYMEEALQQTKEVREIATKYKTGIHVHTYGGAVKYVYEHLPGVLAPDVLLAHCTGLSEEEILILKKTGATVGHSPSALRMLYFDTPVVEMIDAGVTVGLGTDAGSTIGDRSFDLFKEMWRAALHQRKRFHNEFVMPPGKLLEMATIDGARAIGKENEQGSIEIGKKADIILVDLKKPHLTPFLNDVSTLVWKATGQDVDTTIVDGKVLMQNRKMNTVNETEVLAKAEKVAWETVELAGVEPLMSTPERFWSHTRY